MARIRSLHPGQASDEDFVGLSMEARYFCLMLRCHADDYGVFEWKPKTLKMKIFPADNIDVVPLLDELQDANQVKQFTVDGKSYGAFRNFRKWQKPKTPSSLFHLPNELRSYVGLSDIISDKSGNDGEIVIQKGGREEIRRDEIGREEVGDIPPDGVSTKAPRGTRLPPDWQPTAEQFSWAREARSDLDVRRTAEIFRDYWIAQPGQKGVKTDWDATWRNWVRRQEAERQSGRSRTMQAIDDLQRRLGDDGSNGFEGDGTPGSGQTSKGIAGLIPSGTA